MSPTPQATSLEAEEHRKPVPDQVSTKDAHNAPLVYTPPEYWQGSKLPKWLQWILSEVFIFITIHYNLWLAPFLFLFYYLIQHEYYLTVVAMIVVYLPSFLDGSESTAKGRQWDSFRTHPMWHIASNFLGIKIIREQALDSNKKYIFGYHPHGIIVLSRIATITVYPGGVPEIFLVEPKSKENVIILKKRLGFVKLAMRHGADLVPTFVFGEKWLYHLWTPSKNVVDFVRKTLQIPLILFWGRFMWMPFRPPQGKTFGVVYGKPISVELNENPSDEELHALHATYMREVERLFRDHKKAFGYDDDETLVIT
ncbi:hypothetical protein P43SY_001662 [Pythium insidiosum]|uniref:Acyltransferase n=1 Tax=Pythium insidiosum TaxID=114742 RepID=A0AAD5M046_PYTIN|nr:hypothetical protein P43SY_001662 [Pythium insidiosum]